MTTPPPLTPLMRSEEAKTPAQSIWSLIFGILSIGCLWLLGSIPAIILGIAAVKKIDRSGGALKGRGLGIAGIVTGSIGVFTGFLTIAIFAALAMPAYNNIQERAKVTREVVQAKQVLLACMGYGADHDGRFPESLAELVEGGWIEAPLIESTLVPGSAFLYRPGLTATLASEVLLASPEVLLGKRIIGRIGGVVEAIPEAQFQSDYAHLFP